LLYVRSRTWGHTHKIDDSSQEAITHALVHPRPTCVYLMYAREVRKTHIRTPQGTIKRFIAMINRSVLCASWSINYLHILQWYTTATRESEH
jgi:hypothetical protein